jgi:glycosyltransferase involved in cell wall biosynthesis
MNKICILPRLTGIGGMASFQNKLTAGLAQLNIQVTQSIQDTPYDALLVNGGTRDLIGLKRSKRTGFPIIQRLNGMNWIHKARKTGVKHYLRAEYGNLILTYIRNRIADRIVYQSEFARSWWERVHGSVGAPAWVVHNGVDLDEFNPHGEHERPTDRFRILMVEGNVGGGYEFGLETGYDLLSKLNKNNHVARPVELVVVGAVDRSVFEKWDRKKQDRLQFLGQVPHHRIPEIDRSAHVLYSADINAACPNSVVEAMACGLPVAGFDTGALAELIPGYAGKVIPYGGNPWKLDRPDIDGLSRGVSEVFHDQERFRESARAHAEIAYDLNVMVKGYMEALAGR